MDLETVTEIGIEAETQTSINKKNDIEDCYPDEF